MLKSVPARPNLEFDRKQAKALLSALQQSEAAAITRCIRHHPRGVPTAPRLADAQLVVAREYGFPSWPQWKAFVETRHLARQEQAALALKAICSSDFSRGRTLLEADPKLTQLDFHLACACGDEETALRHLTKDPSLAKSRGGVLGWTPLEYICFSRWLRVDADRAERMVRLAGHLLQAGADPNAHHSIDDMTEYVLHGAAGIANHPALTKLLLDAGADINEQLPPPDPSDPRIVPWSTESLYHACEFRDTRCLGLLLEAQPHPLRVSYCLLRILDHENPEGVRLFLAYGADPNLSQRFPALHRAVEYHRSPEIIEMLLTAGARVDHRDSRGFTPYQQALRHGRTDIAALLLHHGAIEEPIPPEDNREDILNEAARRNDLPRLKALLAEGVSPNATKDGTPALHAAAWRGQYEATKLLLDHRASLTQTNSYGGDALSCTLHGSLNCFDLEGGPAMRLPEEAHPGDYARIVEEMIAHGAALPRQMPPASEAVCETLRRFGVRDAD